MNQLWLKSQIDKLRAEASRGSVSSAVVFTMTDPIMDRIAQPAVVEPEDALIGRLQSRVIETYGGHGTVVERPDDDCIQAAAALAAYREVIPLLRAERDRLRDACTRAEFWLSTHPEGAAMRDVIREAMAGVSAGSGTATAREASNA